MQSRAPQGQSLPQKTFSKVGFAAAARVPGQGEVQTPARAGWGGPERVRLGAGPGRRARLLRARGVPAARSAGRGRQVDAARVRPSVCLRARRSGRPLRAVSCGCSGFSLQRGWRVGLFFSPPFCACVCMRVCAKYRNLGNERWALAARGEPSGRQRGRLRARGETGGLLPAAGGEVATLSAVPAFIKEKGEC